MIDILVLSFILSKEPMTCRTDEQDQIVCFDSNSQSTRVVDIDTSIVYATVTAGSDQTVVSVTDFSPQENFSLLSVAEKFKKLSAQWSAEVSYVSSTTRATAHPNYQAIIKLGWDAVPLMLKDLQNNRGFWFPALNAITGIRPFDQKDAGNSRRMTQAWLNWGKRKGLI
jgi:hypothetical protein